MNIVEMTMQIRVADIEEGQRFYERLLQRAPDFIPHEGFAEWELLPKCWLQVAEGTPAVGSGPLRFGVLDIRAERERLQAEYGIDVGELYMREGVPVTWCTFDDPWGNRIGLFEELIEV